MKNEKYLHGFNSIEQNRLYRQARFLETIIYSDIDFSGVKNILEVGSGVGAQSEILLRRFPDLFLTGIDSNDAQIKTAKKFLSSSPVARARFEIMKMDAGDMDFLPGERFNAGFLCWVLEHVPSPPKVLSEVRRVLAPGSKVIVNEVLNSSFFIEPYSPNVLQYWLRYNDLQYDMGGDPFIGAKLGNILQSLGYVNITTRIKTIMYDNRNPGKRAEMIGFWAELLLSGTTNLIEKKYINKATIDKMKSEMKNVSKDPNAVFFYSFVQAEAYTS